MWDEVLAGLARNCLIGSYKDWVSFLLSIYKYDGLRMTTAFLFGHGFLHFLHIQGKVAIDIATLQAQMIVQMDKDSCMDKSRLICLGPKRLVDGQLLRSAHHVHRPRFDIKVSTQ